MRAKDYESATEVASADVNTEGVATFELDADESSYFFVRFEGDDNYIGGTSETVPVQVRTVATAALKGHYGQVKGVKLYRSGDVVKVRGGSHPALANCNYAFYLQRYVEADDKWQYVTSVPACRDAEGEAIWLRKTKNPGTYRVRTSLDLTYYVKGYSDWFPLKVKP